MKRFNFFNQNQGISIFLNKSSFSAFHITYKCKELLNNALKSFPSISGA